MSLIHLLKVTIFLQHQMNFAEFIKTSKDIARQGDWRRCEFPGQSRSNVIKC